MSGQRSSVIKGLDRGDIVVVDLNPTSGHNQGNERPCVILSGPEYNDLGILLMVAPITSKVKGYPFEVVVNLPRLSGVVQVDQIRSIDPNSRKISRFAPRTKLPFPILMQVQSKLDALLFR